MRVERVLGSDGGKDTWRIQRRHDNLVAVIKVVSSIACVDHPPADLGRMPRFPQVRGEGAGDQQVCIERVLTIFRSLRFLFFYVFLVNMQTGHCPSQTRRLVTDQDHLSLP
jgi:hypothetical protein